MPFCSFFSQSESASFLKIFIYAIDWQTPEVFACNPALPVSKIEDRMTDWQSAPYMGLTTQLLQGTAD